MRIQDIQSSKAKITDLNISIAESCTDQGRPEGKEFPCVSIDQIAVESTRIAPVPEAYSLMIRSAAKIDDDTRENETDDQSDLHGCENDFGLFYVSKVLGQVCGSQHTSPYSLTPQKLRNAMTTRNTVIQTAGLTEVFQNWIKVAAALSSAGTEIAIVYQKFQPVAAPRAGSMNAVAWRTKPPVTGMKAVISPVVYDTPAVMNPMKMYAKSAPTGPALAIVFPELRKRPVP